MKLRRDQSGSGTTLIAGVCLGLLAVTSGVLAFVGWGLSVERAQGVADLAAVGAAQAVLAGADGCLVASRTASEGGAELADCEVRGEAPIIVVEVTVKLPVSYRLPAMPLTVARTATAGTVPG